MNNEYSIQISKSISWDCASHISALITGTRGSGKTFFCLSLIAMMATMPQMEGRLLGNSELPTQLFAIDLKNSDIARLSELLPPGRVANNKEGALELLEQYVQLMEHRLDFIKQEMPFGSTAKTLNMPMYYLLIDEWSATSAVFNDAVTREEKIQKFKWFSLMHKLMMLNRGALFGVIIATQQATVVNSGLSSAIQEEVGLKVHMGPATKEAYRLTFGNELKIPNERMEPGSGMLWLEGESTDWAMPFMAPLIETESFWDVLKQALKHQDNAKYLTMTTVRPS